MALFQRRNRPAEPETDILQRAAESFDARIEGDALVLPHSGARLRLEVAGRQSNGVTLQLWADHPDWDRTLFDVATGVGPTPDQGLTMALANVLLNVVHLIDHQTAEAPDDTVTTRWAGHDHRWSVWAGNVMTLGAKDGRSVETPEAGYWPLFKDGILARLGNQKVTYVKVTAMLFGDDITAEVRLNNVISSDLTRQLRDHIQSTWPPSANLMHKQLIWLVQDPATTLPYPHTASDIGRYVVTAGQIFDRLWNQNPEELPGAAYPRQLDEVLHDPNLVDEMWFLVPEIVAQLWYNDLPGLEAVSLTIDGVPQIINVHQLASYAHLYSALEAGWCQAIPEQTLREWLATSASQDMRQQVVDAGSPVPALSAMSLAREMSPGYLLR